MSFGKNVGCTVGQRHLPAPAQVAAKPEGGTEEQFCGLALNWATWVCRAAHLVSQAWPPPQMEAEQKSGRGLMPADGQLSVQGS